MSETNPENSPSGYEDSYQKRERLEKQLDLAVEELGKFIKIGETDHNNFGQFFEGFKLFKKDITEEMNRLIERAKNIKLELGEMQSQYKKYKNKIFGKNKTINIVQKIAEKEIELDTIYSEIKTLPVRIDIFYNEAVGLKGDYNSTKFVLLAKLKEIKDLEKQIKEINED